MVPAILPVYASATFTRPNDTTQYAVGDLVANSATAGSVALMSFALGQAAWLRQVRISKSDVDIVGAQFRLWLINDSAVTFSNGDNGALAIASSTLPIANVLRPIDLVFDFSLTGSGDLAYATFDKGLILLPATTYGFLEARATYTPGAQEVFVAELRGEPQ